MEMLQAYTGNSKTGVQQRHLRGENCISFTQQYMKAQFCTRKLKSSYLVDQNSVSKKTLEN